MPTVLQKASVSPAAKTIGLTHGPVVGAVTPNSARVFIRTNQAAQAQIAYGLRADGSDAKLSAGSATEADADFTMQLELNGLAPDTTYYLNVLVDGTEQANAPLAKFKTFPPDGTAEAFTWVMLTDFSQKASPAFAHAARENPAFVIIGGDFDHSNPNTLDAKRQMFRDLYDPKGVRGDFVTKILRQFAVAHMWDDHDLGVNNADRTYANKALALQVLQEYFPVYPVTAFGDWQRFTYGNADFFMLDERSQRDPDLMPDGPGKSMLDGEHLGDKGQLAWLKDGLKSSKAQWKFILSPVPFNRNLPKRDSWSAFLGERTQLVDFIHGENIRNVIFISGDIHAGAMDDGTNSDFPEMVVPSPNFETCMTVATTGTWSHGFYGAKQDKAHCSGYGVIQVETDPPRVILTVKNEKGETQLEHTVSQNQ